MAQVRVMPGIDSRFTRISNAFCRDRRVKPRAARVFIFLRSHIDGWRLTASSIATKVGMGSATVNKALQDLEDLGYLRRVWERDEQARFTELIYEVYEEPVPDDWAPGEGRSGEPESSLEESAQPAEEPADTPEETFDKNCETAGQGHLIKNRTRKNRRRQIDAHKKTNSLRRSSSKKTNPPSPPEGGRPPAVREKSATRGEFLPEGWEPPRRVIDSMLAEHPWLTERDLWSMHLRFSDYWAGVSGARGRKRDWSATWRNWVRRDAERYRHRSRIDQKLDGYREAGEAVLRQEGLL